MTARALPPFIRISEVSQHYPVSDDTIRRWEKAGKLKIHRPSPGISMIARADIERAIVGPRVGPGRPRKAS